MNLSAINKRVEALEPGESLRLEGLNSDIYHQSLGLGSSAVKKMIDCPAVFKEYIDNHEHETTDDQMKGSAIHCLILEPFDFDDLFIYQPEYIKTRTGKVWADFKESNQGKTILRPDWPAMIDGAVDSVLDNFRHLFSGGSSEVSFWRRDLETGVLLKSRLDYELGDRIIDLKTTVSVSPERFSRDMHKYLYPVQAAMYKFVADKTDFIFCSVEKKPPYLCGIFECDEEVERLGFLRFRKAVADISHCQKVNHWPGYTSEKVIVSLSPWQLKELEDLE